MEFSGGTGPSHQERIRLMHNATLGPTDHGVSAEPALVGTPEWWRGGLATVRPLSSPEVKRLGLVRRTEELRNG